MECPRCQQQRLFLTKSAGKVLACRQCQYSEKYHPPSYDSYHDTKYAYKRLRTVSNDPLLKRLNSCFSEMNADSKVLDYGCGAGDYAIHFSSISKNVIGLDRDVAHAKKNSKAVRWIAHSNTKLPFSANAFDFVMCVNVIEHMYDFSGTMSEICRVLNKGGKLFISTYDTEFFLHKILYDNTHLYEWTETEFTSFVGKYLHVHEAFKYGSFFNYYPFNFLLKELLRPELCVLAAKS